MIWRNLLGFIILRGGFLLAALSYHASKISGLSSRSLQRSHIATFSLQSSLKTLIIDNFDSYTYNIYQSVAEINGSPPIVITNHAYDGSWETATKLLPHFDNIIVSPGPGNPTNHKDFGLCRDAILSATVPVLGVCLGHQGIGALFGGKVVRAKQPMHGRLSKLVHENENIFQDMSQYTEVVRYHSLVVDRDSFPAEQLQITAWTVDDNEIMGIKHRTKPIYGVQFHPESIKTMEGNTIFRNFARITRELQGANSNSSGSERLITKKFDTQNAKSKLPDVTAAITNHKDFASHKVTPRPTSEYHVMTDTISLPSIFNNNQNNRSVDIRDIFQYLYENSSMSFLLDGSFPGPEHVFLPKGSSTSNNSSQYDSSARPQISYLGALDSPGASSDCANNRIPSSSYLLLYNRTTKLCTTHHIHRNSSSTTSTTTKKQSIFTYLSEFIRDFPDNVDSYSQSVKYYNSAGELIAPLPSSLPTTTPLPHITRGLFGYLGYELGEELYPSLQSVPFELPSDDESHPTQRINACPDACFLHPETYIQYNHQQQEFTLIALHQDSDRERDYSDADVIRHLQLQIAQLKTQLLGALSSNNNDNGDNNELVLENSTIEGNSSSIVLTAEKSLSDYKNAIASCLRDIQAGETYEVCLTTQFHHIFNDSSTHGINYSTDENNHHRNRNKNRNTAVLHDRPFQMYRKLQRRNPAPHAAYLRLRPLSHGLNKCSKEDENRTIEHQRIPNIAICCSSPEQYLRIDQNGIMVSKPIKGTMKRASSASSAQLSIEDALVRDALVQDAKTQAENLMIVDLVRNDFGRVCELGSVSVPRLMDVETYRTVHQMVSTITGRLYQCQNRHRHADDDDTHDDNRINKNEKMVIHTADNDGNNDNSDDKYNENVAHNDAAVRSRGETIVQAITATFPGGSMTGAPKQRTMEIIRRLEQRPRGVYSGALGVVGDNGVLDLNIIIRTALLQYHASSRHRDERMNCHSDSTVSDHDDRNLSTEGHSGSSSSSGGEVEELASLTIGAGGAIVAMSNVTEEILEVLVKAQAVAASWGYTVEFPVELETMETSVEQVEQVEQQQQVFTRQESQVKT